MPTPFNDKLFADLEDEGQVPVSRSTSRAGSAFGDLDDADGDDLESRLSRVERRMREAGYPIRRVSQNRTTDEQAALYAQGRTAPGSIVTNADGKTKLSEHQRGNAVDYAFEVNGGPSWAETHPWDLLGQTAREEGLEWGGDFKSLTDRPHLQMPRAANQTPGVEIREQLSGVSFDPKPTPISQLEGVPFEKPKPAPAADKPQSNFGELDDAPRARTIPDMLRSGAGSLGTGLFQFTGGMWGAIETVFKLASENPLSIIPGQKELNTKVAQFAKKQAEDGAKLAASAQGNVEGRGFVEEAIDSGIASVTMMSGTMLATLMGVPPVTALVTTMGVPTAGQASHEALNQGVPTLNAAIYGLVDGTTEVVTEMIPFTRFVKDLQAGAPFARVLWRQLQSELPGEQLATLVQDFDAWVALPSNANKSLGDFAREVPSAAASTLIATATTVGLASSAGHIVARASAKLAGADEKQPETAAAIAAKADTIAEYVQFVMANPDTVDPDSPKGQEFAGLMARATDARVTAEEMAAALKIAQGAANAKTAPTTLETDDVVGKTPISTPLPPTDLPLQPSGQPISGTSAPETGTAPSAPRSAHPITPVRTGQPDEALEQEAIADYEQRKATLVDDYVKRFGRIANVDDAAEMFESILHRNGRWQNQAAIGAVSRRLVQDVYDALLAEPINPAKKWVEFTGGGTGSGKTSAVNKTVEAPGVDFTLDSALNNFDASRENIDKALQSGRNVLINFTYRDAMDAFTEGVIPRMWKTDRAVTADMHAAKHVDAPQTFLALMRHYAGNPRVQFGVTENRERPKTSVARDDQWLENTRYTDANALRAQLLSTVDDLERTGQLTPDEADRLRSPGSGRDSGVSPEAPRQGAESPAPREAASPVDPDARLRELAATGDDQALADEMDRQIAADIAAAEAKTTPVAELPVKPESTPEPVRLTDGKSDDEIRAAKFVDLTRDQKIRRTQLGAEQKTAAQAVPEAETTAAVPENGVDFDPAVELAKGPLSDAELDRLEVLRAKDAADEEMGEDDTFEHMALEERLRAEHPDPTRDQSSQAFSDSLAAHDIQTMPPDQIMPAPAKTVQAKALAGAQLLSPEDARAQIATWKAEAQRIGREEDHSNEVIISLFDRTGAWSQPYVDAGFDVRRYDKANGDDLMTMLPIGDIVEIHDAGKTIVGVLAAPPCTSFAVSGARWWADQHDKADQKMVEKKYGYKASEYFDTPLDYANTLVAATQAIIEFANPTQFHAVENPVGRIAKQNNLPKPLLAFDPANFGDPYTKKTFLWGSFNPELPTANVEPTKGSFMHTLRGDNPEQKAQRSITPEGFAYAFFMANHQAPVAKAEKGKAEAAPATPATASKPANTRGAAKKKSVTPEPTPVAFSAAALETHFGLNPEQAEAAVAIAEAMDLDTSKIKITSGGTPGEDAMPQDASLQAAFKVLVDHGYAVEFYDDETKQWSVEDQTDDARGTGRKGDRKMPKAVTEALKTINAAPYETVNTIVEGDGPLFQQAEPVNAKPLRRWYYSNLSKAVESFQKKGTIEQWQAHVKKFKGANEEAEAIGLAEWLDAPNVTRDELTRYLDQHQIQVQTVDRGAPAENERLDFILEDDEVLKQRAILRRENMDVSVEDSATPQLVRTDSHFAIEFSDISKESAEAYRRIVNRVREVGHERKPVKYAQYQLPGGTNYREVLLTLPASTPVGPKVYDGAGGLVQAAVPAGWQRIEGRPPGSLDFHSGHWDEPNVLAHIRLNDRTVNDQRVLFVEEIQSDWHQRGRKHGYTEEIDKKIAALNAERDELRKLRDNQLTYTPAHSQRILDISREITAASVKTVQSVPDAPFKGAGWKKLALKRVLALAAEGGYDGISWTTGSQQNERYKLSHKVKSLRWRTPSDASEAHRRGATKIVEISTHDGPNVDFWVNAKGDVVGQPVGGNAQSFVGHSLDAAIGKDVAEKIIAEEDGDLSGEGLDLGGKGMVGFYDKELPNLANDLVKKYGVKVGTAKIREDEKVDRDGDSHFTDVTAHFLPLSQALREDILDKGLPLFQGEKAAIEFVEGGKAVIRGMDKPDVSSALHELFHAARRFLFDKNLPQDQREGISDADIDIAAEWAGARKDKDGNWEWRWKEADGTWNVKAEEKFARGGERYLYDGKAPIASLNSVFQKIANWLAGIYQTLKASSIDIDISPAMRVVYDKLVSRKAAREQAEAEHADFVKFAQEERAKAQEEKDESTKPVTHWMNRGDIEHAVARFKDDPVLGPAARFLQAFQEEVDRVSDGWPYWSLPSKAARQLTTLLYSNLMGGMGAYKVPAKATAADVWATMGPIKSFMTRRGEKAGIKLPKLELEQPKKAAKAPTAKPKTESAPEKDGNWGYAGGMSPGAAAAWLDGVIERSGSVRVRHAKFGEGWATAADDTESMVRVEFDDGKTMSVGATKLEPKWEDGEVVTIQTTAKKATKPQTPDVKPEWSYGLPKFVTDPHKPKAETSTTTDALAEEKAKSDAILKKLRAKLSGSQANMGVDPEIIGLMIDLLESYVKQGVLHFKAAVQRFHEDWGSRAEEIDPYLESAWEAMQGETVSVAEALKAEPEERKVEEGSAHDDEPRNADLAGGAETSSGQSQTPARRPRTRGQGRVAGGPAGPGPTADGGPGKRSADDGVSDADGGDATPSGRTPGGRSAGVDAASHADAAPDDAAPEVKAADARGEEPRHFVITDDDILTAGGAVSKLNDNIAALKLLKQLEAEKRPASAAEQLVLSRYVGWGNSQLTAVFELRGVDAIRDPKLKAARQELEAILTPKELKSIADSVENAHYSFAAMPRAIWSAVQRLGFKGGAILEPAVGAGHFLGTMPGSIVAHPRTRMTGVDLEPIASGIARQLYQDATIQTSPLEEAMLPKDYYDLVISNVPFSQVGVFDPEFVSAERKIMAEMIHNYYFGKALDVVRPGGLIAFVTSSGTMDSKTNAHRQYIEKRAEFLGAIRLPREAFKKTAGTEVVADIIFLRRLNDGEAPDGHGLQWMQTMQRDEIGRDKTTNKPLSTNEYFVAHPEMILGTEHNDGKLIGRSYTVHGFDNKLDLDKLQEAIARLPENIYQASKAPVRKTAKAEILDSKQGSYVVEDGKLMILDQGTLVPSDLQGQDLERALSFIPLRDAYQRVLDALNAQADDDALAKAQKTLMKTYKAFVKRHGPVNKAENRNIIENDPNGSRVTSLENVATTQAKKGARKQIVVKSLADIFTKRVIAPPVEPTTSDSPTDALSQSMAWKGQVDLEYMGRLLNQTPDEVAQALAGDIFQDPVTEAWYPKALYLAGDVVTKLAQAEARATVDPNFAPNAAALKEVQPTPKTIDNFTEPGGPRVPFGASYVPIDTYRRFISEVANVPLESIEMSFLNTQSKVEFFVNDFWGQHEYLQQGTALSEWIADTLNGRLPTKYKTVDGERVKDVQKTEEYHESMNQLREQWATWWPADPDAGKQLADIFNAMFNREVPPKFDEVPLVLPSANAAVVFRPWQNRVVVRVMLTGNTLINHAPGGGKTLAAAAIAMEWKRRGLANKILIPVPNPTVEGWRREFMLLYPTAKVLIANKEDFQEANRKRLLARITSNNWDAIVVGHKQFESIPVKTEYARAFIQQQEDELIANAAEQMHLDIESMKNLIDQSEEAEANGDKQPAALNPRTTPASVRDIVRAVKNLRKRLRKRLAKDQKGIAPVTFEEMGIDALIVDEAHYFKNLFFSTSKNNIKGLSGSDSDRAIDMFLKVRQINAASKNRNLVFLTGTPLTNTMSEVYTIFRYLAQEELDRLGMAGADAFFNNYAIASSENEPVPGGGYKEVMRLRDWNNLKELSLLAGKFTDTVTIADMVESGHLTIPKMKGGQVTTVATKPHEAAEKFMQDLVHRLEDIKAGRPMFRGHNTKTGKDIFDNYLTVTNDAKLFAIDPRLIDSKYAYDPNGRIPMAAKKIADVWKASKTTKGTQLVFLDTGVPDKPPPLPDHILRAKVSDDAVAAAAEPELSEEELEIQQREDELNASDFDLYSELRRELVKRGVPNDEIAYIHQARNPEQMAQLFDAVNAGTIRVFIATRAKGGVGVNVQKKVVHVAHLDVPWRPDMVEQSDARGFRQGNENAEVEKSIFVTEKSFDEFQWGLLATKNKAFSGFWKGDIASLEDVDTNQISFEVASALATGDPRTLELLKLEKDVRLLQGRATNFDARQRTAQRQQAQDEARLTYNERYLDTVTEAIPIAEAWKSADSWQVSNTFSLMQHPVDIVVEVGTRYGGSLSERDTPLSIDIGTPEGRAALQTELQKVLKHGNVWQDTLIATAGPYRITAVPVEVQVGTGQMKTVKVWGVSQVVEDTETVRGASLQVSVGEGKGVILGSTPDWTGREAEKAPDYMASLRSYLRLSRLQSMQLQYAKVVASVQQDLESGRAVLSKTFKQGPELKAKRKQLNALRIALGMARVPNLDTAKLETVQQLVAAWQETHQYEDLGSLTEAQGNERRTAIRTRAEAVGVLDAFNTKIQALAASTLKPSGASDDTDTLYQQAEPDPDDTNVLYQEAEQRTPLTSKQVVALVRKYVADKLTRDEAIAKFHEEVGVGSYREQKAFELAWKALTGAEAPKRAANINLDKFPLAQDAKRELALVLAENDEYLGQRRGVRTWAETRLVAESIPQPKRVPKAGKAFNAEELDSLAGHIITVRERIDEIAAQIADGNDGTKTLAQQAKLLAQEQVLMETYAGAVAEAGRALNILRKVRQAIALDDEYYLKAALAAAGGRKTAIDIAKALRSFDKRDAIGKYRFIRALQKAKVADWLSWYWYVNILSGPVTHMRNLGGNMSMLTYALASKPTAVGMDVLRASVTGTPRTLYLGEFPAQMAGLTKGFVTGLEKGLMVLRDGFTMDDVTNLEFRPVEVPGGLWTNVVGRSLEAADTLFRSMRATSELYARAYASAMQQGLKPGSDPFVAMVTEFISRPPLEEIKAIERESKRSTFREEPGHHLRMLAGLRNDWEYVLPAKPNKKPRVIKIWNPIKFVFPFVQTPANIMKMSVEATPIGFAMAPARQTPRERAESAGRAALGTMLLAPLAMMVAQGMVSGAGPDDKELKDELYRMGWQPNSIRVGDTWYNYQNFQPLAFPLSILANAYEAWVYSGETPDAGEIALRTANTVLSASYLSGLAGLQAALEDPDRQGRYFFSRLANSLMPLSSLRGQIARAIDPVVRQPDGVVENVMAGTPGLSTQVRPRYDALGDEAERGGSIFSRLFSPVTLSEVKDTPLERELWKLRNDVQVGFPQQRITIAGESVKLTPDEYAELLQRSGQQIKADLERHDWSYYTTTGNVKAVKRIVDEARDTARAALRPKIEARVKGQVPTGIR